MTKKTDNPESKTPFSTKPTPDAPVLLQVKRINNPGGGDCAFYAFAIGLIDIIQEEQVIGKQDMFNRWVALAPSLNALYDSICRFDMKKQDVELLKRLQKTLRTIYYETQLQQLREACVKSTKDNRYKFLTATKIYNDFSALYYGIVEKINAAFNLNANYNLFANSKKLRGLVAGLPKSKLETSEEKITEAYNKAVKLIFTVKDLNSIEIIKNNEQLILAPLLIRLIYGSKVTLDTLTEETPVNPESLIIKLMQRITQDGVWGTLSDLTHLASVFNVNLCTYLNNQRQPFEAEPAYHTIFMNNENDIHWTTRVCIAETVEPTKAPAVPLASGKKNLPEKGSAPKPKNAAPKPSELKTDGTDKYKLTQLRHQVTMACIKYSNYSSSIWFSLFHRHGGAGRARERLFREQFASINNYDEAKRELLRFLADNNDNGNKHPHSLRTMILHEVLESQHKISLQTTSAIFDYQLERLKKQLNPDTSSFTLNL